MKLYIASTSGYSGKTLLALALSPIWSDGREPLRFREQGGRAVEKAASRVDVLLLGGAANLRDGFFLGLSPLDIISSLDCRVLLLDRLMGGEAAEHGLWG